MQGAGPKPGVPTFKRVLGDVEGRYTTTMTTNTIANHIASKGVTKHMDRKAACRLWADLKAEGWIKDGSKLVKPEEHDDSGFLFERVSEHKTSVRYVLGVEVTA